MATSGYECAICIDGFKNPKLIPCHHSFCYKCLEGYVQVKLHNGCFNCPICRTSVRLPENGIAGFQNNFYIDTEICGPKNVAITIGAKLNQAEKELQALRIQNADAVAEVNRYKREIAERDKKDREDREKKERDEREKKLKEERERKEREKREKKERDERVKKEREERQIKEWSQKMETRVKDLEEELSSTRKQYEVITISAKLNQAEKEIQALRIHHAYAVAEVNRYKREIEERERKEKEKIEIKERERKQILAFRQAPYYDTESESYTEKNEEIKTWMCTKCQGWTEDWITLNDISFNCKCDGGISEST